MAENNEIQNDPTQETVVLTTPTTGQQVGDAVKTGLIGAGLTAAAVAAVVPGAGEAMLEAVTGGAPTEPPPIDIKETVNSAINEVMDKINTANINPPSTEGFNMVEEALKDSISGPTIPNPQTGEIPPAIDTASSDLYDSVDGLVRVNPDTGIAANYVDPATQPNKWNMVEDALQNPPAAPDAPADPTGKIAATAVTTGGIAAAAGSISWRDRLEAQRQAAARDTSRSMGA